MLLVLLAAAYTPLPAVSDRETPPAPSPVTTRACRPPHDRWPFCNTSLPLLERVDDLISRLDASEIPPLLTAREGGGGSPGPPGNISRLGLPEYDWGVNCVRFSAASARSAARPCLR